MTPSDTLELNSIQRTIASKFVFALILGTLPGCFPYVMSYVYLDSPGVNYLRFPCRDGAPVGVMYQRNEARFEVTLEPHGLSPLKDAFLKIRAPRDVLISIPNPIARITYRGAEQGNSSVESLSNHRCLRSKGGPTQVSRR